MHRRQYEKNEDGIKRNADLARIILNNNPRDKLLLNGTTAPVNHSAHGRRLKMRQETSAQVDVPSLSYDEIQEAKQVEWHREELKVLSSRLGLRKQQHALDLRGDKADTSLDDDEEALIEAYLDIKEATEMREKSNVLTAWKLQLKLSSTRKKVDSKALNRYFRRWQRQTEGLYHDFSDDVEDSDGYGEHTLHERVYSPSREKTIRSKSSTSLSALRSPVKKRVHSAFKKLLGNVSSTKNHQILESRIMSSKFVVNRQIKLKYCVFSSWLKQIRLDKEQRNLQGESLLRQERISKLVNSIKLGGLSLAAESKAKQNHGVIGQVTSVKGDVGNLRSETTPSRKKSEFKREIKNANPKPPLEDKGMNSPQNLHHQSEDQDYRSLMISPPRSPSIVDDPRVRVIGSATSEAKDTSPNTLRDSKAFNREGTKNIEAFFDNNEDEYDNRNLPPPPAYTPRDTSQSIPRKATKSISSQSRKQPVRLVSAPTSDDQRVAEKIARKQELRERAKAIMTERKMEDEMRQRRREEREEKEVERIKEERRLAREAMSSEEKHKLRQQELAMARIRKLNDKARGFYNMQLMVKYGIAPLRILLESSVLNMRKANVFYTDLLAKKYWCLLYGYTNSLKASRMRRDQRLLATAKAHFSDGLLHSTMKRWKMRRKILRAKAIAVSGQNNTYLRIKRGMNAWKVAFYREIRIYEKKLRDVSRRGNKCVMKYYWHIWNDYVTNERIEREIRVRSKHTWDKVKSYMSYK